MRPKTAPSRKLGAHAYSRNASSRYQIATLVSQRQQENFNRINESQQINLNIGATRGELEHLDSAKIKNTHSIGTMGNGTFATNADSEQVRLSSPIKIGEMTK